MRKFKEIRVFTAIADAGRFIEEPQDCQETLEHIINSQMKAKSLDDSNIRLISHQLTFTPEFVIGGLHQSPRIILTVTVEILK